MCPLPAAAQVKSITIKFDHPQLELIEFAARPEDWKAIRATLLPAKRDQNPADWEWIGTVRIVKNDDQPFRVELYTPSRDPGAFAAGATFAERAYYRGGDTEAMVEAVSAAYEKSKIDNK